jgi:hypothetical protein
MEMRKWEKNLLKGWGQVDFVYAPNVTARFLTKLGYPVRKRNVQNAKQRW